MNKSIIEICKFQECLYLLNFSIFWPTLDCLILLEDINNLDGDRIYSKYFIESKWNLYFSAFMYSPVFCRCCNTFLIWALYWDILSE